MTCARNNMKCQDVSLFGEKCLYLIDASFDRASPKEFAPQKQSKNKDGQTKAKGLAPRKDSWMKNKKNGSRGNVTSHGEKGSRASAPTLLRRKGKKQGGNPRRNKETGKEVILRQSSLWPGRERQCTQTEAAQRGAELRTAERVCRTRRVWWSSRRWKPPWLENFTCFVDLMLMY